MTETPEPLAERTRGAESDPGDSGAASAALPGSGERERLRRFGTALLLIGIAFILWGVFHVLGSVRGGQPWPTEFAERKSYNQVKTAVHGAFFGGFLRAFFGLALCVGGLRLRERARDESTAQRDVEIVPTSRVTVRGYAGPSPARQAEAAEGEARTEESGQPGPPA